MSLPVTRRRMLKDSAVLAALAFAPSSLAALVRFEGEEAYIAVYLEGPGAGQPPDTVAVWAASSKDCTILSFAWARI